MSLVDSGAGRLGLAGLGEAFGLAVCARSVRASEDTFDDLLARESGDVGGAVSRAIVAQESAHFEPKETKQAKASLRNSRTLSIFSSGLI